MTLFLLVAGLVILVLGADWLVKGASGLASAAGVPPLVIGLTVVAFGTSAPELSVSVASAVQGKMDLALGNVVGSNILNVLFILGVSAIITPLVVQRQLVRLDVPLMIGSSVLLYLLTLDGLLGRVESAFLLAALIAYTALQIVQGRREGGASPATEGATRPDAASASQPGGPPASRPWYEDVGLVLVGLALLVLGSRWFVGSAVELARALGMSELLIGLTLVALGTSLPELATSVMASIKGERDLAVGNVVGSNIFNILGVLGMSGLVASGGIPVSAGALGFDLPVMIAVAVACLPVFFSGHVIARWEGWLFLAYYAAYTAYIGLAATEHEAAPLFGAVMLQFVVPITVLTLALIVVRSFRRDGRGSAAA